MRRYVIGEGSNGPELYVQMIRNTRDKVCGSQYREVLRDCLAIVKQNSLFHMANQDGALARSMTTEMIKEDPTVMFQGKVTMMKDGKQLPYAWMEEKGGIIKPRPENRLQRLVWTDSETGQLIFAKQVTHKGKNYMTLGAKDSLAAVNAKQAEYITGQYREMD